MLLYRNQAIEARPFNLASPPDYLGKVLKLPVLQEVPNEPFKSATDGYILHFASRNTINLPELTETGGFETNETSIFMQALHGAFSEHIPFSLSPETLWYLIVHEVAVHIRLNQDKYRGYFTASAKKETIHVRDDSLVYGSDQNMWGRSINLVRDPMKAQVPQATIDLMLPKFSTSNIESDTALLVLFLDMVSNYYGLMWHTLCGIPSVRVEGTPEDWKTIVSCTEEIKREFKGLEEYFADLLPVIKEIAASSEGSEPDPEFWNSIYKYNDGSGGPFINGWITAFFAHQMTPEGFIPRENIGWRKNSESSFSGLVSSDLPVHLSLVPFDWDYYGRMIKMAFVGGVMGVEYDGFLNPRLGFGVLENAHPEN